MDLFFIKNGMSIKEVNFHHVEVCEKAFIADEICTTWEKQEARSTGVREKTMRGRTKKTIKIK